MKSYKKRGYSVMKYIKKQKKRHKRVEELKAKELDCEMKEYNSNGVNKTLISDEVIQNVIKDWFLETVFRDANKYLVMLHKILKWNWIKKLILKPYFILKSVVIPENQMILKIYKRDDKFLLKRRLIDLQIIPDMDLAFMQDLPLSPAIHYPINNDRKLFKQ